jgi:hypothetical protein
MVKIWFEDIAWINEDGETIPMNYGQEIITNYRLIHEYNQPTITTDSWNGKEFPVQTTMYDRYRLNFAVKELSHEDITKMQCCKKIWVHDFDNNEIIEVDTSSSGQIAVEQSGRLGVVEQGFTFSFSSKKTCIYPAMARLNTYYLTVLAGTTYTYYTDFAILNLSKDPDKVNMDNDSGLEFTVKAVQKIGKKAVFFLMEATANLLKQQLERCEPAGISLNGFIPVENVSCKITELTEGLCKCDVEIIISALSYYYA